MTNSRGVGSARLVICIVAYLMAALSAIVSVVMMFSNQMIAMFIAMLLSVAFMTVGAAAVRGGR